jgi:hypothetical protein
MTFAPAWTFAALLNGPAFLLGGAVTLPFNQPFDEFGRVLAAAVFWFCVGWIADRRNRQTVPPLSTNAVLNVVVLFSLMGISARYFCSRRSRSFLKSCHGTSPTLVLRCGCGEPGRQYL